MKKDPLAFALDVEAKGTQMYLALAAGTTNKLAKLLFYSLAGKEVEHARRFDIKYASLLSGDRSAAASQELSASLEQELKLFFDTAAASELKKGTIQLEGYETAMKLERTTYDAYKKFHDEAATPEEKHFFAALMSEENEHYVALANVYLYLTDNGDWLQEDEGATWNWMNT